MPSPVYNLRNQNHITEAQLDEYKQPLCACTCLFFPEANHQANGSIEISLLPNGLSLMVH